MSLIDYFNAFQVVSDRKRFSANVRSLYFAILGEFNKAGTGAHFLVEMFLRNDGLQHLSGIKASSSFDAARNALINAKLITYKGGLYSLCGVENKCIPTGNVVENAKSTFEVKKIKDKKTEDQNTNTDSNSACASTGSVSAEVARAWERWENRKMKGGEIYKLWEYETLYGTAAVVSAIDTAGENDKYDHLTMNYIQAILKKKNASPLSKNKNSATYRGDDLPPISKNKNSATYSGDDLPPISKNKSSATYSGDNILPISKNKSSATYSGDDIPPISKNKNSATYSGDDMPPLYKN